MRFQQDLGLDGVTQMKSGHLRVRTAWSWGDFHSVLHSVTFQAFTDTPCAVSHGVPWLALHPRASQPPWPCLRAWVLVCMALVYFWLVT